MSAESFAARCSSWARSVPSITKHFLCKLAAVGATSDGLFRLTFKRETPAGSLRYLCIQLSPDDLDFLAWSPAFREALDEAKARVAARVAKDEVTS